MIDPIMPANVNGLRGLGLLPTWRTVENAVMKMQVLDPPTFIEAIEFLEREYRLTFQRDGRLWAVGPSHAAMMKGYDLNAVLTMAITWCVEHPDMRERL